MRLRPAYQRPSIRSSRQVYVGFDRDDDAAAGATGAAVALPRRPRAARPAGPPRRRPAPRHGSRHERGAGEGRQPAWVRRVSGDGYGCSSVAGVRRCSGGVSWVLSVRSGRPPPSPSVGGDLVHHQQPGRIVTGDAGHRLDGLPGRQRPAAQIPLPRLRAVPGLRGQLTHGSVRCGPSVCAGARSTGGRVDAVQQAALSNATCFPRSRPRTASPGRPRVPGPIPHQLSRRSAGARSPALVRFRTAPNRPPPVAAVPPQRLGGRHPRRSGGWDVPG